MNLPRRGIIIACALAGLPGRPAAADQITSPDRILKQVEIVGYANGAIEYRTKAGEFDQIPVRTVAFIELTSVENAANFREAEEYMLRGQAAQAVPRYERAVRAADGYWENLFRARLLVACDEAGNLPKTVRTFQRVVESDPVAAAALFPQIRSHASPRSLNRTARRLDEQLNGDANTPVASLVLMLRYVVRRSLGQPEAAQDAAQVAELVLPGEWLTERTLAVLVDAWRTRMQQGQADRCLGPVNQAIAVAGDASLPVLLLVKAELLAAVATTPDERLRAGLPAMRVAIHFADTPEAGAAMLLAAQLHEQTGRSADAVRLFRACLKLPAAAQQVKDEARSALTRLRKDRPDPDRRSDGARAATGLSWASRGGSH